MNASTFKPISITSYQAYLADCWDLGVGALTFEQWQEALSATRQQVAAVRSVTPLEHQQTAYQFYLGDCKSMGIAPLTFEEWTAARSKVRDLADAARKAGAV